MPLDATVNEESMIRMAVADVGSHVDVDDEHVKETVRRHVDNLHEGARIKSFVGILAERRTLRELKQAR